MLIITHLKLYIVNLRLSIVVFLGPQGSPVFSFMYRAKLEILKKSGTILDASVASDAIGLESALILKYWVWFYRVEQVVFSYHFEKVSIFLPKEVLVFSTLLWYIS